MMVTTNKGINQSPKWAESGTKGQASISNGGDIWCQGYLWWRQVPGRAFLLDAGCPAIGQWLVTRRLPRGRGSTAHLGLLYFELGINPVLPEGINTADGHCSSSQTPAWPVQGTSLGSWCCIPAPQQDAPAGLNGLWTGRGKEKNTYYFSLQILKKILLWLINTQGCFVQHTLTCTAYVSSHFSSDIFQQANKPRVDCLGFF